MRPHWCLRPHWGIYPILCEKLQPNECADAMREQRLAWRSEVFNLKETSYSSFWWYAIAILC